MYFSYYIFLKFTVYTQSIFQIELATYQLFNSHLWLLAAIPVCAYVYVCTISLVTFLSPKYCQTELLLCLQAEPLTSWPIPEFRNFLETSPLFWDSSGFQLFHHLGRTNHQQGRMISLKPRTTSVWAEPNPQNAECPQRRQQSMVVSSFRNSSSCLENFNSSNSCCFHGYLISLKICPMKFIIPTISFFLQ